MHKNYVSQIGDAGVNNLHRNYLEYTSLFPDVSSILIPKKAENNLRKYVSKALLKKIDSNRNVAVEKCLVVLSNLASTFYTEDCWKNLSAQILHQQVKSGKDNTYVYQHVIEVLKTGTSKGGPMIEVMIDSEGKELFRVGEYSRKFKLAESYKTGLVEYKIKDKGLLQNLQKSLDKRIVEAVKNPICANLFEVYRKISLPATSYLLSKGRNLVREGYCTSKGKNLTMRNKHHNHYWKDFKERSFVEDNIKLFESLTKRGYLLPTIGKTKSGGRIVDSFCLMPKWIRNEIMIDGKKLVECDYRALHPNIATKLYGGSQSYLTHNMVAKKACISEAIVKVEHLSFFNKRVRDMKSSPLFSYYFECEPKMLKNICDDKNKNGYKVTSRRMFNAEVAIMTDVIKRLNSFGIYVIYVYDALLCQEKDLQTVKETMNEIVKKHDILTTVKDINAISSFADTAKPDIAKYEMKDFLNLYDFLPKIGFSVKDSMTIIMDLNTASVSFEEFLKFVKKSARDQKYNDYHGVRIDNKIVQNLRSVFT